MWCACLRVHFVFSVHRSTIIIKGNGDVEASQTTIFSQNMALRNETEKKKRKTTTTKERKKKSFTSKHSNNDEQKQAVTSSNSNADANAQKNRATNNWACMSFMVESVNIEAQSSLNSWKCQRALRSLCVSMYVDMSKRVNVCVCESLIRVCSSCFLFRFSFCFYVLLLISCAHARIVFFFRCWYYKLIYLFTVLLLTTI